MQYDHQLSCSAFNKKMRPYTVVQALHAMLANPDDKTRTVLLYGNRSVKDILCKELLDAWAAEHPERFKVVYMIGSRWRLGLADIASRVSQRTLNPRLLR